MHTLKGNACILWQPQVTVLQEHIWSPHIYHSVWWPKVKPELGYLYLEYYCHQPTPELDTVKPYLAIAWGTIRSREISKKERGRTEGYQLLPCRKAMVKYSACIILVNVWACGKMDDSNCQSAVTMHCDRLLLLRQNSQQLKAEPDTGHCGLISHFPSPGEELT